MISIADFCTLHGACEEGRNWALFNCTSVEDAWQKLRPDWLIWVAVQPGVLTDKELRLFAVWSARQVQHMMKDPRSLAALDVAERHAHGQATDADLAAARSAARSAAWSAARDAARDAARSAARSAAWSAACAAGRPAAWDAACAAQAAWLRQNTTPNFKGPQ